MRHLILSMCFLISSFFIYSQSNKKDSIYVLIDKNSYQFKMNATKGTMRSNFSILKYRFRTKKLQKEHIEEINKTFLAGQTPFYMYFYSYKKPIKQQLNTICKVYSIEEVSKNNLNIGYGAKFFFIEKLDCSFYKVYETYLQYEE